VRPSRYRTGPCWTTLPQAGPDILMVKQIRPIDKSQVLALEEGAGYTCFSCAERGDGIWRLVGYDEYGELWICQDCWEAAPDLSASE